MLIYQYWAKILIFIFIGECWTFDLFSTNFVLPLMFLIYWSIHVLVCSILLYSILVYWSTFWENETIWTNLRTNCYQRFQGRDLKRLPDRPIVWGPHQRAPRTRAQGNQVPFVSVSTGFILKTPWTRGGTPYLLILSPLRVHGNLILRFSVYPGELIMQF